MTLRTIRMLHVIWAGVLPLLMLGGCAYEVPYVKNQTQAKFDLERSAKHRFTDLVAYVDDEKGRLVVFGKVEHAHGGCLSEGHVDLAIVDAGGAVVVRQSLPIVNRGGKHGWHGAAFRTRIDIVPAQNSKLRLAFHDNECVDGEAFDCGANVAAQH